MSLHHFLKKYIPTVPDWFLSGVFLVLLVWLVVLSIEFSQFVAGRDLEFPTWNYYIRPLYAPGWLLAWFLFEAMDLTLLPASSWLVERMRSVLLYLITWRPVYFIMGTLFVTKRKILGIALLILNFVVGWFSTFMITILLDH